MYNMIVGYIQQLTRILIVTLLHDRLFIKALVDSAYN